MAGSDFDGFMQQPLIGPLLGITCFFGILLILALALIGYLRYRRARKVSYTPVPSFATDEHEMPGLDLLVSNPASFAPASTPAHTAPAQPPPSRPVRKGTFSIRTQDGTEAEAVEVMTVLRDVVDGQLIVQMGDKAYQNISTSPEFRDRFSRIMRELGQITAQVGSTPASTAPETYHDVPAVETEAEDQTESVAEPIMPVSPAPVPAPKPRPASAPPPVPRSGTMPGDLPSFKLEDNPVVKPKRGQKLDIKPVPEINIAGAIEAYLQYKLQHTPEYTGHSIHIYPSPDGGVSIEVDGQYYQAVSDVTDNDVREFIAQAIQEWQERH